MKYKRIPPIIIEAFQYDGDMIDRNENPYVPTWAISALDRGELFYQNAGDLFVNTFYGTVSVHVGDYIVKSECGALYPLGAEIFEKAYKTIKER